MKRLLPLLLAWALLCGCGTDQPASSQGPAAGDTQYFFAMDTLMSITAYDGDTAAALVAAQQEINRLEALWSRTRPESDVSRLNAHAGDGTAVPIQPETAGLLETAAAAARESGLAFDPVLAPVMDAWGFGLTESEATAVHRVPGQEELSALLPLTRDLPQAAALEDGSYAAALPMAGQAVDLGGIAKGASAAYVVQALTAHGVENAILSLGGNITALGSRPDGQPFRVLVTDPLDSEESYLCTIALGGGLTCSTSGGYERYFTSGGGAYHHIIDPATGYPAQSGLLSVTTVAADPALADAWSTALFVLGLDRALELWRTGEGTVAGMELILVTEDQRIYVTQGLEEGLQLHGEETGYTYEIVRR